MIIETSVLNNRYRLDKKVGQGGFAQVFLATDLLLERRVALKVLNSELTEDGDFQERFTREAKAIATLDHPNILPIFDYGQAEDTAYLVTPFVDGGTLYDKMRAEKNISPSLALRYLQQMASALDYAHRRNIVHRDIKPHNMLLRSEDNHLFLADFGIAKVLSSASSQSRTSAIGTISYMSPEQLAGNVGKATDIYSLGCVLFQMLTGQVPYTGPTEQVIMGHINGEIPSVVERSQGRLSPAMQQVFNRALAKRPENRYQSAAEMALAFEAALNNNSTGLTSPLPEDYSGPNAPTAYAPTEVRIPPVNLTDYNLTRPGVTPTNQNSGQPSYNTPTNGYGNTPPNVYYAPPASNVPPYAYPDNRVNQAIPPAYEPAGVNPSSYGWNNGPVPPQPPRKRTNWLLIGIGGLVIVALIGVVAFLLINNSTPKPPPTQVVGVVTATATVPATATSLVSSPPAGTTRAPTTTAPLGTVTAGNTASAPATTPPTTAVNTTPAVTTNAPTTAAPTTASPTTAAPTTAAPTTPPTTAAPTTSPLKINKTAINQALQSLPGATSVYIIYPDGTSTSDDGDRAQPSASVIKLWISATAYQEAKAGRLNLEEQYTVQKSDIASGTGILVNNVGKTFTYRQVISTMLTYSDNSAANIVIRKLGGFAKVNTYAQSNGYPATKLQRLLGDTSNPNNNFTSGKDAATMLYLLSEGKVVDGNSSLEILQALVDRKNYSADQNFFSPKLSAGYQHDNYLHISGTGTKVRNEVGLIPILNSNNMIVAILDMDMPDEGAAENAIASAVGVISGAVSR